MTAFEQSRKALRGPGRGAELSATGGLPVSAPCWVPRSPPGRAGVSNFIPMTSYASAGLDRGGIDERWFASTT